MVKLSSGGRRASSGEWLRLCILFGNTHHQNYMNGRSLRNKNRILNKWKRVHKSDREYCQAVSWFWFECSPSSCAASAAATLSRSVVLSPSAAKCCCGIWLRNSITFLYLRRLLVWDWFCTFRRIVNFVLLCVECFLVANSSRFSLFFLTQFHMIFPDDTPFN